MFYTQLSFKYEAITLRLMSSDDNWVSWAIGIATAAATAFTGYFIFKTWRSTQRGIELEQNHFLENRKLEDSISSKKKFSQSYEINTLWKMAIMMN
jgi:hypothetical protein